MCITKKQKTKVKKAKCYSDDVSLTPHGGSILLTAHSVCDPVQTELSGEQ